jgi:hypothetical protein
MRAFLIAALLFCGLSLSAAQAHAKAARWTATSTTSMAITGDIAVTANSIRFGNGAVVGLKPPGAPDVFTLDPQGRTRFS